MPNAGVPRSSVPGTVITTSHTATQQWQSFEVRMRQRRAERCRLRAESAIDLGALDDAQEALDEARRLQPDLPGLLVVEHRLVEARIPRATTQPARRTRRTLAAAASIAVVAAGLGALMFSGRPSARLRPAPILPTASHVATFSNPAEQAAPAMDPGTQPGDVASNRLARTAALDQPSSTDPQPQPATPAEPAPEPQPPVTGATANVLPAPEPRSTTTTAFTVRTTPTPSETPPEATAIPAPLPALPPERTIPVPAPATSLPPPPAVTSAGEGTTGSGVAPGTAAPPTSSSAVTPGQPAAEGHVRAALARYEAAYNSLNAAGARAVWPTVDARALARAFESLQTQHVSLGNCTIAVSGDGLSARATCAGTATWTPKVGGGTRTAPRSWLFELEPNGDRWQILRATTR